MKLIECVPNFSEGNDKSIIDKIIEPVKSNKNVTLLDVDMGEDTNRTVVTFIGNPDDVIDTAFECIKIASKLIDMSKHSGEHPRMGATDVCPLIPLKNVSMKECILLSKTLASKVGKQLNIPVYLYENSATKNYRKSLSIIRKGEYEGLDKKITQSQWKPDYGQSILNIKAGATAIGAREFLIAYNINLNTNNKKIATDIALDIRESGRARRDKNGKIIRDDKGNIIKKRGKFKFCKAVGWYIDEYNQAQVSINLTNYKKTSLHKVFEEVRKQARKRGVRVTGSEIVGLLPLQAMINSGKYYLKLQNSSTGLPECDIIETASKSLGLSDIDKFNSLDKIIDFKISSESMKFKNNTITEFIDHISRSTPTPGGGSVSALASALGASLSSMVANLSINKKELIKDYDKFISISENCQEYKEIFLNLIDEDSKAYDNVIKAIRLPKKTTEDNKIRYKEINNATVNAANVPLEILEQSVSLMKQTLAISEIGNKNSITDVGVSAHLIKAAAYGAGMNVLINLKSIDKKHSDKIKQKVDYYLSDINDLFIKTDNIVNKYLDND